ncbi:MAG: zinc ribbon domain-containing protein [Gemmataceae bacterium]|nr:zinc ribbon domain-containing protein [Gemmataceae bacterium]
MPTYPYHCRACGHRFEELQSFSEPPLTKCPECKKNKLERQFGGGGAIIFKGSGFYETDYRRAGESKPKADGDAPATETKADAPAAAGGGEAAPASPPPPPPPAEGGKSSGKGGGKKAK